jgi:hypothetical protein
MLSPRISLFAGVWVIVLLISRSASSTESCPLYPLGVTSQQTNDGETYYASAFARPFREGEEASIEARQEARLSARLYLKRDKRVPLGANGRLLGVKDDGSCVADGRVYFSVSLNLKSAAQAIELNERLQKSVAAKPSPEVPSYSWSADESEKPETKKIQDLLKR